ncbi:hypothetical protein FPV67DRAFT_1450768 [Lyophyllum atratum]|nr:hypothetical protein FPV67DRAFT_1450768 [Lyophyllum atratum]
MLKDHQTCLHLSASSHHEQTIFPSPSLAIRALWNHCSNTATTMIVCTSLELPDDVFGEIMEHCDILVLRRLVSTSERLRRLASPILLSKQKFHLQALVVSENLNFDGDAVQRLFQDEITSTPHLQLVLAYDVDLCETLQSFRVLLSHLDSMDRMCLYFTPLDGRPQVAVDKRWMFLVADVLNQVVTKTRSLTVMGADGWPTEGLPFYYDFSADAVFKARQSKSSLYFRRFLPRWLSHSVPTSPAPIHNFTSSPISGPISEREAVQLPRNCEIVLPPSQHPALSELNINSSLLFQLPFSEWTLHLLSSAPIRKLTFENISLPIHEWDYVFADPLTMRSLNHVLVTSHFEESDDLDAFLKRHRLDCGKFSCMGKTMVEARLGCAPSGLSMSVSVSL